MEKSWLRIFPMLSLVVFLLPVVLGLFGTWLPAFGYLPVIGADYFSLEPFSSFFQHPGTPRAISSTLLSGLGAPILASAITFWIIFSTYGTSLWRILIRLLAPLLAIPHAAFAIGFAFLIAPSGWFLRILSPEILPFTFPPDIATVRDPYGISLTIALAVKEVPFLLLMSIGARKHIDVRRSRWIGGSLGYGNFRIWSRLIVPQIYPELRLPRLAVLAYSLSVVDIAMILGPTVPPTLSFLLNRWFNDPSVSARLMGAAGATFLFCIVALSIGTMYLMEHLLKRLFSPKMTDGNRTSPVDILQPFGHLAVLLLLITTGLSLLVLLLWSFTRSWRFPETFPASFTLRFWEKAMAYGLPSLTTTAIAGFASSIIALILVLGCLEYEVVMEKNGVVSKAKKMIWVLYLPLIIPQISFLFGVQTLVVLLRLDGKWFSLIGAHLIFVLPYVFLTISAIYRKYDKRFIHVATSLGGSPFLCFLKIKLPMLLKPISFAMATGFSVSVVQYLPTLYVGAGRFTTITTETVSLTSGSDRRILAVYALLQFLLPVLTYFLAILLPNWLFRNRRGMQH